jgi:hypothetical protein
MAPAGMPDDNAQRVLVAQSFDFDEVTDRFARDCNGDGVASFWAAVQSQTLRAVTRIAG